MCALPICSNPVDLNLFRSQFNHSFLVVSLERRKTETEPALYKVAFGCKYGVRTFSPVIPSPSTLAGNERFRDFFLTKLINGERAAMFAPDFAFKMTQTRQLQLASVIEKFASKSSTKVYQSS